jgi:hypothetical protein
MFDGSHEEREALLQVLRDLRAQAAAELLSGNQAALPRHLAVQDLIEYYEGSARLRSIFDEHRRSRPFGP